MTKINVTTHSGDDDIIEVIEYSATELASKLNDNEVQSIALGDNVYSRIDIKNVKPVQENLEI